jgi:hypothetical protein
MTAGIGNDNRPQSLPETILRYTFVRRDIDVFAVGKQMPNKKPYCIIILAEQIYKH